MKLGCPTVRTILRTWGWMTCTVGGLETLLTSCSCSWWQPAAAADSSRQPASPQGRTRRFRDTGQGDRRIGCLRMNGQHIVVAAPVVFGSSIDHGVTWVNDRCIGMLSHGGGPPGSL